MATDRVVVAQAAVERIAVEVFGMVGNEEDWADVVESIVRIIEEEQVRDDAE